MQIRSTFMVGLMSLGAVAAFGQTNTDNTVQRDVNQQTRIDSGVQNGSLTIREASRLESEQARIDRLQAKDLRDGKLDPKERARLQRAQNQASRDIHRDETNRAIGDPASKSSERMQADVQRNVNQEARIEQGLKSGSLTDKEAGKLERGQAREDHVEAVAGKNGHISTKENLAIDRSDNRQSEEIFDTKHNSHRAGGHKG